ncbi:hypothetical protein ACHAWU_004872 [Discostella pseudostelligera]|uniref:Uncharacterized protein n=1 Tax=Discostella pseudostelligera TaxID=259834 RepID=A0ABD3M6C3_9STRA
MLPPRSHHRLATVTVAFSVIVLYFFRSLTLTIIIDQNRTNINEFSSQNWEHQKLPQWLDNYFHWHNSMRHQYPGLSLFTHPDSPGVLIKSCAFKCGGLHDRFGGLGWDLYLANQTKRVLLIHWCIPAPIEYYLVPNVVDWTLPRNGNDRELEEKKDDDFILDERLFSNTTETHFHCDRAVQSWPGLFDGYSESRPGVEFWESQVDLALHRAIHGEYAHNAILRVQILGFDVYLEKRLRERHGEMDAISWTDSFPTVFWRMFRPSKGLQKELDAAFVDLGLLPSSTASSSSMDKNSAMITEKITASSPSLPPFYAIHVRIRHPRGHVSISMKGNPDKFGLEWEDGPTRDFAVNVSEHAFHCAQQRAHLLVIDERRRSNTNPSALLTAIQKPTAYVFFADSEELVTHMGNEYREHGLRVRNIIGKEVVHIDRQQEMSPESYYDSFVDLFVAAEASCIIFGAGNYALLAAKINRRGARQCLVRHYPDSSHSLVLRNEFLDCDETYNLARMQF